MTIRQRLRLTALFLAVVPAAMLGFAYYAEYQMGLLPCILCLYQRPPHFAAIVLALLAALAVGRSKGLGRLLLGLAALALLVGAGIAGFHAGVEWKWWPGLAECGGALGPLTTDVTQLAEGMRNAKIVQCDQPSWVFLGLSMAAWNAVISFALALIGLVAATRRAGTGGRLS